MPLMGSLYIGSSGLQTSQNALNTTAHNLSNVDTTGYTRQQVQQSNRAYVTLSTDPKSISNKQTGLGVTYSRVKQVRDYFLDKTYRKESGRSMFYEVSTEVMEEVESQLGELNGEAFQTTMTDFWTAIQELSKDPSSSVTQGLIVQRANEFVQRAGAVYDGLSSYQNNLNTQIKQNVDKINKYGNQLLTLNDQIRAIESGGIEHANDLRDARNQILDELAELTNMTFSEDRYGSVSVQIEGVDFVKDGTCYEIALKTDEATGFYTPFWPQDATYTVRADGTRDYNIDGAEVFDLSVEISSDLNTDVGGLKAMLLARGDHRANYTDLAEGKYDGELADGTKLENARYCTVDPDGYMRMEDGSPIQLFTKVTTDGYEKVSVKEADGSLKDYWVMKKEDPDSPENLYTIGNLQVNPALTKEPSKLGFRLADGSEDKETADALKAAFTEEAYTLNPNVQKKTTFVDYYTDLVSQVSNSGYVFRSIYENQVSTVEATQSAREQVIGVSTDEELSNMIKFQNAYNASSRYINVISEMLEHILSTLGV